MPRSVLVKRLRIPIDKLCPALRELTEQGAVVTKQYKIPTNGHTHTAYALAKTQAQRAIDQFLRRPA